MFEIGSSKRVHKSDWRCSGVPFYRARDIEDLSNGFFKSELYIDKKFYEDCKTKYGVPEINDILISAVGTLGKVFVVRDKSPFYYKDGNIICLYNFSNTNPDFIKMLFASSFIEKQIHGGSHGVTVDTYTIIRANQTLIPLPSRSEQDRIVKVWEKCLKELAVINNCKDEITKICGIAKTKILDSFFGENSLYKSYYGKRLTTTLKELVPLNLIGDGDWVLSENMDSNGEFKLIQLKHISNGNYLDKPYQCVNNDFFEKHSCSEIKENYLLINRLVADSMSLCIVPKLPFRTITAVDVCWIAPSPNIYNQEYLMYYLMSPGFQSQLLLKCGGTTRKRISKSNLINIPLHIHNIKYQEIIGKRIKDIFLILDNIAK